MDVAWRCSNLARLAQQCFTWACTLVWISIPNMFQHIQDGMARMAKHVQHGAPNNVAIYMYGTEMLQSLGQQCWDMLSWYVAIIWQEPYTLKCISNLYMLTWTFPSLLSQTSIQGRHLRYGDTEPGEDQKPHLLPWEDFYTKDVPETSTRPVCLPDDTREHARIIKF